MKFITLLRANCKSQKGSLIGIWSLIFIITLSLCAILSIWKNANGYESGELDRIGYGDLTWWVSEVPDTDALFTQIKAVDAVEKAEKQDMIYFTQYCVNGHETVNPLVALKWNDERYAYHIFKDNLSGIEEDPAALSEGEVYVSPAFCSLYDVQIGDEITIAVDGAQEMARYTIKGYFEDPAAGSSMMGIKNILMNEQDIKRLSERVKEINEPSVSQNGSLIHIHQKEDSTLSIREFQVLINDNTDIQKYCLFNYPKSTIMGFMLILQDIFSGFLLVFVLVLLVITMIIIGHSISSSIEQDYVDMGILKAVGFTQTDLRLLQMLQYLITILSGMVPGVLVSAMVVKLINRMTVTTTGLIIPADMPVCSSMLVLGIILLLLIGFICIKTTKIGRITPIRAIRGGADDVYFNSRFTAQIHKRGLSFHLAYRQLIAGKKQYISACLVAALLVFFLSLTVRIDVWMGPDGKGLMAAFGATEYDLGISSDDQDKIKEADAFIVSHVDVADQYQLKMWRGSVNGIVYLMYISSEPSYYNLLEGRTCKYDNELVITDSVAKELDVSIGDTVKISYDGVEKDFIVSGIYQCANDMGANFGISLDGFERLGGDTQEGFYTYYLLSDKMQEEELARLLEAAYGDQMEIDENTWSGLESISQATSALEIFMYVITMIFILITVSLTGSKILYKEQHDLGIYKSLGFMSEKLRFAFALRFCIVALVGSVLGIVISALLTDPMVSAMLKMCGVSRFSSSLNLFQMILPAIIVSMLFLAFTYLTAGKVKKVEPGILIVE